MSGDPVRRAVMTGHGALSALGGDAESFWSGLLRGECGLAPIRGFSAAGCGNTMAGEVRDFQPERWLSAAECERFDRITQLALCATREALAAAALDPGALCSERAGVILATTLGGMAIGEDYQRARHEGRPFAARRLLRHPYYVLATQVARVLGVRGPVVSPAIACASGTHAIGLALDLIRCGHGELFVCGGAEALCGFVVSGFNCLRATTADPVRPFDARRNGLQLGEGAAVVVVEELDHARRRGVRAAVEVTGSGLAGDAVHMTAPARDGAGAGRAMRAALADAGVEAAAIDFVSAHGTGTVFNDAMECAALESVLGDALARVPVNSIKGAIGHTLGAAGAFEAIMCARILRSGVIPPTVGCTELDPACRLDVVRGAPRRHAVTVALSTSSAFAGSNAAIVLRTVSL